MTGPRQATRLAAVGCLVAVALSCAAMHRGMIRTSGIEQSVLLLVTRHDQYVEADFESHVISASEHASQLAQSARLIRALEVAPIGLVKGADIKTDLLAVAERHDAHVLGDANLEPSRKQVYLMTSRVLRRLVEEATR